MPSIKLYLITIPFVAVTMQLENNTDWYLLNKDHGGYFRVWYDDRNYEALEKQLQKNKDVFSPEDRAGLIMDILVFHELDVVM